MAEHHPSSNFANPLPIPCDQCYSVESIWRRIPYEPDSRTPTQIDGSADDEPACDDCGEHHRLYSECPAQVDSPGGAA